jgi:hypothetical protein
MKKRFGCATAILAATLLHAPANAALVIHTAPFIPYVAHFNSFEGLGLQYNSFTGPYSSGGITVEHIGSEAISTTSQSAGQGSFSWFTNPGSTGYTSIRLAGAGGLFDEIQFLAGSSYAGAGASLYYELLAAGSVVGSGLAGGLPDFPNGWVTFGFSGLAFDEVRLQALDGGGAFNPLAPDGLALDAVTIGGTFVPEPSIWAMMILGFGMIGGIMRKRQKITVSYA